MKPFLLLILLSPFWGFSQAAASKQALEIGETLTFHSNVLTEERRLHVYLPASYGNDTSRTYPVIYLLDGSLDEDFLHIAGLVQFGSFPWIQLVEESIVVGIANVDRKRDFTFPTTLEADKTEFPTSGGSGAFMDCLAQEIQPLIDKTYRTNGKKTILGQSLAGLLATEILLTRAELFDSYFIVSPSLWWDTESLLGKSFENDFSSKHIYIAVGKEGKIMERDAKKLHKKLRDQISHPQQLHFRFFKRHDHGDVLHQAVYQGLEIISKE